MVDVPATWAAAILVLATGAVWGLLVGWWSRPRFQGLPRLAQRSPPGIFLLYGMLVFAIGGAAGGIVFASLRDVIAALAALALSTGTVMWLTVWAWATPRSAAIRAHLAASALVVILWGTIALVTRRVLEGWYPGFP